jgi:dTDP-4-dehydrorhamnose reductase
MTEVLVVGRNGQLASELKKAFPQWRFCGRAEMDIRSVGSIKNTLAQYLPKVVINTAAYTAVDLAETEKDLCFDLNADAVYNLGEACKAVGCKLIHVSTDFVFDGTSNTPYTESAIVSPLGNYGKSKYQGEKYLEELDLDAAVVRTSWLYSSHSPNFVLTMLRLAKEKKEIKVVWDQVGSPTWTKDLAQALNQMVLQKEKIMRYEVYHYSNEGLASWYDLAYSAIHPTASASVSVLPILSSQYPTPAERPNYSVLSNEKIKNKFNLTIPNWRESLSNCLEEII